MKYYTESRRTGISYNEVLYRVKEDRNILK